jgi:Protein of unknown function (DUF3761)
MRRLALTLVLGAILLPAFAQTTQQPSDQSQPQQQAKPEQPKQQQPQHSKPKCADKGTYINSKGETVKRPENCSAAPERATAQCRDGSYSFSHSRSGTCSHHGGVAKWL